MIVVYQGVIDSGARQRAGQGSFPNALGKPCTLGAAAKMFFNVIGEPQNLFGAVFGWNRNQDRLVEAAPHHFNLPAFHKLPEAVEKFRLAMFDPFQQRSRIVQPDSHARVAENSFQERRIRLSIRSLEHVVEIPDGLMGMN